MHGVLKKIVDSSIGGFNRMIVRIHSAIESQVGKIRASMEMSRIKKPPYFDRMPQNHRYLFSQLFYRVSDKCLKKLHEIYQQLANSDFKEVCDDYWFSECFGLPCPHTMGNAMLHNRPIQLAEINRFWKQIEWDRIVGFSGYNVAEETIDVGDLMFKEMSQKYSAGLLKKSTVDQVLEMYNDLENPRQSSMQEPTGLKPRGRPQGSKNKKYSTKRDLSGFEHCRINQEAYEKQKSKEKTNEKGDQAKPRGRPRKNQDQPVPSGSQWPTEAIIFKGVNFGVQNIDQFWYPFIDWVRDVRSDGHCGYRSLSVLIGKDEEEFSTIRWNVAAHLVDNRPLYEPVLKVLQPIMSFESYVLRVGYTFSPCPETNWLDMPMIGLAFATVYQVALAFLSWTGPCLCLPMKTLFPRTRPLEIFTIAHVGKHDHFIPVSLLT